MSHLSSFSLTTTTTTSLFQIKYSLQSMCPQLAKAIRGEYKRKKKRKFYKYIYNVYILNEKS